VGGGCFWCVEAVLQRLPGVTKLVSVTRGGHVKNPTYEQVATKPPVMRSGAGGVDPAKVKLDTVLDVFLRIARPTTPNRQGNDVGPQYRSVIYYANSEQRSRGGSRSSAPARSGRTDRHGSRCAEEIFTPPRPTTRNYYNLNKDKNPYCSYVIAPKVNKLWRRGSSRRSKRGQSDVGRLSRAPKHTAKRQSLWRGLPKLRRCVPCTCSSQTSVKRARLLRSISSSTRAIAALASHATTFPASRYVEGLPRLPIDPRYQRRQHGLPVVVPGERRKLHLADRGDAERAESRGGFRRFLESMARCRCC
jgi:peptide-methionine (S)-S-oxide reductase